MKKVAVGYAHSGKNIGGVRKYIENIEKLSKHKITLYPSYENDSMWKEKYNMQIRNNYRNNEIKKKQQQIIDSHDVFHSNVDPTWIKLCEEAQKQGKIWIHTYHNIYMDSDEPDGKLKDWQKEINDVQFNIGSKADFKICVGEWLIDECKKKNIDAIYIPNFINIKNLNSLKKNSFKTKYELNDYVLFVGDASVRKNCLEFIKVANMLPQYNFILIGTNLTNEYIENTYNVKLNKNIYGIGHLEHFECLEAMNDCNILIMNSFTEGLPTVLIEAMYFEKPCIIPNGPEWSKYLLNDECIGLKYPIGNIEKLSEKICNIMENYKSLPDAKKYVENIYSSDVIINQLDNLYSAKTKLLISSLDNKFFVEIIELFKFDFNVKIDIFHETSEKEKKHLISWADIIFCEWCEVNALWYSKNKKNNQKLFIRLHKYELFTSFFYNIKWDNVDNLIFIAPEMKKIANKHLLQKKYMNENNFDWKFYLDNNDDLFKKMEKTNYNKKWAWNHWSNVGSKMDWRRPMINISEKIDYDIICDEFKQFNGGNIIFNYVKSVMFNEILKQKENEFNLGIMGILPKIKRPDIALDIIEYLVSKDKRYKLYILSKNYLEWNCTLKNKNECEYYEDLYQRINNSEILKNHVIFENHSENPEMWFSKIGYLLSVSDIEGSHQSIAEAMGTGTIPFIFGKALKVYKLDEIYPKQYCFYEDDINKLCEKIIYYSNNEEKKYMTSQDCKQFAIKKFKLNIIYDKIINLIG